MYNNKDSKNIPLVVVDMSSSGSSIRSCPGQRTVFHFL